MNNAVGASVSSGGGLLGGIGKAAGAVGSFAKDNPVLSYGLLQGVAGGMQASQQAKQAQNELDFKEKYNTFKGGFYGVPRDGQSSPWPSGSMTPPAAKQYEPNYAEAPPELRQPRQPTPMPSPLLLPPLVVAQPGQQPYQQPAMTQMPSSGGLLFDA
jgi:hypothetical protein